MWGCTEPGSANSRCLKPGSSADGTAASGRYGPGMFTTFPSAWVLLALPFVSSAVIADVPGLRKLSTAHSRLTWPIGVAALLVLFAGLVGLVPATYALPVMILAGAVSGFVMFLPRRGDGNGDDWRWRPPPPDDPPPDPDGDGPIDWALFDRLRARWERTPIRGR